MKRLSRGSSVLLLVSCTFLVHAVPGEAAGTDPRIQEHRSQIDSLKDAHAELMRQQDLALHQQQAWVDFYEALRGPLESRCQMAVQVARADVARWEWIRNAFAQLARGRERVALPEVAVVDGPTITTMIDTLGQEVKRRKVLAAKGEFVVGLCGPVLGGWTRKSLVARIKAEKATLIQMQEAQSKGEWAAGVPILGLVSRAYLRAAIDAHTKAIADIEKQLADGTLSKAETGDVAMLEAQLEEAGRRLEAARALAKKGDYPGFSSRCGGASRNGIEADIAGRKKALETLRKQISKGEVPVSYGGNGSPTRLILEEEIRQFQRRLRELGQAYTAGTYAAFSRLDIMLDKRSIMERLATKPGRAQAELLRGSLVDIDAAYDLERRFVVARIKQRNKWKEDYSEMCKPGVQFLELELAMREQHLPSIDRQFSIEARHWTREIARLRARLGR